MKSKSRTLGILEISKNLPLNWLLEDAGGDCCNVTGPNLPRREVAELACTSAP